MRVFVCTLITLAATACLRPEKFNERSPNRPQAPPESLQGPALVNPPNAQALFDKYKCSVCHGEYRAVEEAGDEECRTLLDKSLVVVEDGSMPIGGERVSDVDQQILVSLSDCR